MSSSPMDGKVCATPLPRHSTTLVKHLLMSTLTFNIFTEAIPDITPLLQPTLLGDIATYTFFSVAGLFLGSEIGVLSGASAAKRTITRDPETRARIEKAFRDFRVDVLRKQAEQLEKGGDTVWM
jgi:hypothetical protein